MAGKNLVLQKGQVLFSEGDPSNGMFLVRMGELEVYLEKNGNETVLAKITTGGMIGEMALFDHKPRSASVRASASSEVTHITNDDFVKLMKQIPKWFTALMVTLSTRLRVTNEKVMELSEQIESMESRSAPLMQNLLAAFEVLKEINKVWQKIGKKVGTGINGGYKAFAVSKSAAYSHVAKKFDISKEDFTKIFKGLSTYKIVVDRGATLESQTKTSLGKFLKFLDEFLSKSKIPALSDEAIEIFEVIGQLAEKSPYDSVVVGLKQLKEECEGEGMEVINEWDKHIRTLKSVDEQFKVIQTEIGEGFRFQKPVLMELLFHHKALSGLARALSN